ncbi:sulfatase [Pontiella agarivorans]|uniref:Sulfatase n=1 Tax=Pontiella agarivorans TaxID=3038953 RepID=A0ABU5MX34_9BACT|nr:sulfatase [Pontiella agarivorans]MDZ8118778.1 sulfatase [Pontiella agarivorans]
MNKYAVKAAVVIGCAVLSGSLQAEAASQPNIIMIFADDLGWKDLGCTGSAYYETPNLDALAANGIRFTQAYAPAPVCAPSRGAVLSGRTPARNKFTTVYKSKSAPDDRLFEVSKQLGVGNQTLEGKHRHTLGSEAVLISERLQKSGYTTGFIGKWHIGILDGYRPEQRGYDMAAGYYRNIDVEFADHYIKNLTDLVNLPHAKKGDWREDLYAETVCDFIAANKDRPFFLSYHSYLTHGPFVGKKELVGKYEKKVKTDQNNPKYASMVEALDDSVGKIVEQLIRFDLLENTLLIFTSDNGGCGGTSNYPLMGGKGFSYEGGYRVPLLAHWPEKIPPGQVNSTRVTGVDLYPTFLNVAGEQPDPDYALDGMSLMGEMTGGAKLPERPLYFHYPHYSRNSSPHSIVISNGWKLIRYYNDAAGRYCLFNLDEDPQEQKDLSAVFPERVNELDKMIDTYLESADASLPVIADSDEGRDLLKRYKAGTVIGDADNVRDKKAAVVNKAVELKKAMAMRRGAEKRMEAYAAQK